jgi:hypothetical protein
MSEPGGAREWVVRVLNGSKVLAAASTVQADVREGLTGIMFDRDALLEDVNYIKIVPNHYVVEVNAASYAANYQPIESRVLQQWSERLLGHLMTTNARFGRREFRFGGRVLVELRPSPDVPETEARVRMRIDPAKTDAGLPRASQPLACLELRPGGQRFPLSAPLTVLGRNADCDIVLDAPEAREKRLISGRHAHIRAEIAAGVYWLGDGAPGGKPSLNGTYVNRRRVGPDGARLEDGDEVILAAQDSNDPRPDTPGVATFIFHRDCH